jgi:glutathione S-transferase
MKLYGTPASPFTRKVRVVLQELGLPVNFIILERLLDTGAQHFAHNPLHQLPIFEDGEKRFIESDLICDYLLSTYRKADSKVTFLPEGGDRFADLQRLAIMNGGMALGAQIMHGKRSQIPDFDSFPFFQQRRAGLKESLRWLNEDLGNRNFYGSGLSMLEITLVSYLDWALFREMVPSLEAFPNLVRLAAHWRNHPSFTKTHPEMPV